MSQAHLLKEKRFYPMFWTQFLGAFNDNFLKNAMVILITFQAGSVMGIPAGQMVAVAGGIFILPFFLFSATAGQLADKYDKSKLIRIIKAVEIALMCLATAGFILKAYELLLLTLFLMGLHSTFFGPIKYSILPQHLRSDELIGANALIEAGTFLAILLGTILGGVLIAIPGVGAASVSLGLIAVAIAGYLTSRTIPPAPPVDPKLRVQWNPVTPTWDILKTARKTRAVFLSILGNSWFWFFGAAVLSLFPPYVKDLLKADQSVVTLFLAVFSIGIGIGSLLCERLSRGRLELGLVPFGSIGLSVFAFDLYLCGSPVFQESITALQFALEPRGMRILFDLLSMAIFGGFYIVPLYTMIQERSEASHRSRVIAANNIVNAFFMVISAGALVGAMQLGLSVPQIFLALAIANALVAFYIYTLLPEFMLRFATWIIANFMYRVKVSGEENIPYDRPAVLVCNHVSFIDWLIIGAVVRRPVRFVMDHSFVKGPITRMLFNQAKVIPIASARENPETLELAFDRIAAELREGEIVCIFPEGKITQDGKMNIFRPGIERILQETPVTIVPIALGGLWGSFFSRERGTAIFKIPRRFWSRVTLRIGKSVEPHAITAEVLFNQVSELNR